VNRPQRIESGGHGGRVVPTRDLVFVAVFLIMMLAVFFLDEYLRSRPRNDSIASRVFMAIFGQRRYVFTWPLLALAILLVRRIVVAVLNRWARMSSKP